MTLIRIKISFMSISISNEKKKLFFTIIDNFINIKKKHLLGNMIN